MAIVHVTRALPGDALERLRASHDVTVWPGSLPPAPEQLRESVREAQGLLCLLTERVDRALLDAAPALRAIANYAVGTDNIDLTLTRERGICVGVTPDVLTEATADLAFALLLAAARRLTEAAADARAGRWRTWEPAGWLGLDVHGAALGIVGFGRIGRALARRADGFGMNVRSTAETPLDELLATSDFISLHCPLTERTRGLIGADALARMRRSAILINTARGAVVDQDALCAALARGQIAGAAIDVTDPEPPPPGDPIFDVPNLIVVPHIGSATRTARARMTELSVENLLAGLAGRPMPHPAA